MCSIQKADVYFAQCTTLQASTSDGIRQRNSVYIAEHNEHWNCLTMHGTRRRCQCLTVGSEFDVRRTLLYRITCRQLSVHMRLSLNYCRNVYKQCRAQWSDIHSHSCWLAVSSGLCVGLTSVSDRAEDLGLTVYECSGIERAISCTRPVW